MNLPLAQWFAAVTDLEDGGTAYFGTGPRCHERFFSVKRLRWANGHIDLEPFCALGCLRHEIEAEVLRLTSLTAPLGIE